MTSCCSSPTSFARACTGSRKAHRTAVDDDRESGSEHNGEGLGHPAPPSDCSPIPADSNAGSDTPEDPGELKKPGVQVATVGHVGKTGSTNETSGQAVSPHSGKVEEARPGEALDAPAALTPEVSLQSHGAQGCPHRC